MMNLPHIPTGLKTQMRKNNTVLFIGAGLSKGAGYPDWKELVKGILTLLADKEQKSEKYKEALDNNVMEPVDVLKKIEYLRPSAIKAFKNYMRSFSKLEPNKIHFSISGISPKMITTNFDHLLEKSHPDFEIFTWNQPALFSDIKEYPNYIFKFHGDLNDPERCILFPKDYDNLYLSGKQGAVLELHKICSDQSIIFIGFSLSDPYVNDVLDYISKIYSGYSSDHYIITTEKNAVWPEKITPIELNDYSDLEDLITLLIETKAEEQEQFKSLGKLPIKPMTVKPTTTILAQLLPVETVLVDREDKLAEITSKLLVNKPLVITGVRGLGKTSLAQNWISKNKHLFNHIAFVSITGDMHISFINSFQHSNKIHIVEDPDSAPSEIVEDIFRQMNEKHGNNLLFIDNANDDLKLDEFMKNSLNKLQGWKIIITSITKPQIDYQPVVDKLEISPETGGRIFEYYAGNKFNPAEDHILKNIVEALFLNPVLIEFAANQYKEQLTFYSTSLASFANELITRKKQFFESGDYLPTGENPLHPNSGNVVRYLCAISSDSFETLSPMHQQILLYLSVLPSKFYSFETLNSSIPEINMQVLPQLVSKGWLMFNKDESGKTFKIHEIYQLVLRNKIKPDSENCIQLIKRFNDLLLLDYSVNKGKTVFDIQQYIPMAEEMIRHFAIVTPDIPYDDEKKLRELLSENKRMIVGPKQKNDCTELAALLRYLSDCLGRLSNRQLSYEYSIQSLCMELRIFNDDNFQISKAYRRVGSCIALFAKNKYLALKFRLMAKEISDSDPQTPEIFKIRLMQDIGNSYRALSKYKQSICCLTKCIDILEKKNGEYLLTIAGAYDNLGFTYGNMGRKLMAEDPSNKDTLNTKLSLQYRLKALEIKEKIFMNPDHISIATTHNNIGAIYTRLNDLNSAEYHYQQCYAIRLRKYPSNHLGLALIKNNLARLFQKRVHLDKGILSHSEILNYLNTAEKLCNESIAITKKTFPEKTSVSFGTKFRVMAQILLEQYYLLSEFNLLDIAQSTIEDALTAFKNSKEPDKINLKECENIQQEILIAKQKHGSK